MNKKIGIGIVVVAIVVASLFAGCVEEGETPEAAYPTPTTTSTPEVTESPTPTSLPTATPTPTSSQSPSSEPIPSPTLKPIDRAEITSITVDKVVDYEGYPALNVSIWVSKFTEDLSVTVTNEDEDILDTVIILPEKESGRIRTNLKIGDYHETLINPSYKFTVIVSDAQGELKDNTIRFDGAEVTISNIYVYCDCMVAANEDDEICYLNEMHYTLGNGGPFPAYPDHVKFLDDEFPACSVDFEEEYCPESILRSESYSCRHKMTRLYSYQIRDYSDRVVSLSISVYDKDDNEIAYTSWDEYLG